MADVGNSLTKAFDYVHGRLLDRLAGLGVFDELVHHAAEVSLLRDLYLRKDQLGQ